jgi:hypothetical protein
MLSRDLVPIAQGCPLEAGIGKPLPIAVDNGVGARGCGYARRDPQTARYADLDLNRRLKCRSCRTPRYSPPVHMIKLTQQREITPYAGVHPHDDERR